MEASRGQTAFFWRGERVAEEEMTGMLLDIACNDACSFDADEDLAGGRAVDAVEYDCPATDDPGRCFSILSSPLAPWSPLAGGGCGTDDSKKQFVVPKNDDTSVASSRCVLLPFVF